MDCLNLAWGKYSDICENDYNLAASSLHSWKLSVLGLFRTHRSNNVCLCFLLLVCKEELYNNFFFYTTFYSKDIHSWTGKYFIWLYHLYSFSMANKCLLCIFICIFCSFLLCLQLKKEQTVCCCNLLKNQFFITQKKLKSFCICVQTAFISVIRFITIVTAVITFEKLVSFSVLPGHY